MMCQILKVWTEHIGSLLAVILASVCSTGTLVSYRQPQLVLDGFQELRCVGHGRYGKLNSMLK